MSIIRTLIRYGAILGFVLAGPAAGVPPPPPPADTLEAAQSFIRAMTAKDFAAYSDVLAENFTGHKSEKPEPVSRDAWFAEMREAFANESFHVTILHVFQGGATVDGRYRQQVMLVEKVSNFPWRNGVPGDCCAWHLTETLTIADGKVERIESSTLYGTELSDRGRRTDIK